MNQEFWLFSPLAGKLIAGAVSALFLCYCVYQWILLRWFPQRYREVIFTNRAIAYISLIGATSASVTIAFSFYVPLAVLPPIRMIFESVMVLVVGILMGPIACVIAGSLTEVIVMLFIPSYLHYGFILTVLTAAIIAGFVGRCNFQTKFARWRILIPISLFLVVFTVMLVYYTNIYGKNHNGQIQLFAHIYFSANLVKIFLALIGGLLLLIVWFVEYGQFIYARFGVDQASLTKVILAVIFSELFSQNFVLSLGELALTKNKTYGFLIIYHLITAPPKILFKIFVIYKVNQIVAPLVLKSPNKSWF